MASNRELVRQILINIAPLLRATEEDLADFSEALTETDATIAEVRKQVLE